MKTKKINTTQNTLSSKKRIYTPPSITIYGKLTELTTSKKGTVTETIPPSSAARYKPG
jgi:hypothetical protein